MNLCNVMKFVLKTYLDNMCMSGNIIGKTIMWLYSHLSSKLEEALINNKTLMNLLRQNFIITENVEIYFSVQLEVVNGTDISSSCGSDPHYYIPLSSFHTFCPSNSSDYKWKLCNIPEKYVSHSLEMTYRSPYLSKIESERETDVVIAWLSFLHGNILSTLIFVPYILPESWIYYTYFYNDLDYASNFLYDAVMYTSVSMTLVIERLDCNPSLPLTQCALSELLSWVSELVNNYYR